jgi:uncharacterized damage-inducible protein DinB
MLEACRKLLAHLRWADEQTLAALRKVQDFSRPELKTAADRFMHVIAAEHLWFKRIHGESPAVAVWPTYDEDVCASLMARNHKEWSDLVARPDTQVLANEIAYFNSKGQPCRSKIGDILLHVCMHGAWHRGQVALLMRQAGLEPAPTDYIAFTRGTPAATQKPKPAAPIVKGRPPAAAAAPKQPTPGKAAKSPAPAATPKPAPPAPAKPQRPTTPTPARTPKPPAPPGKPRPPW